MTCADCGEASSRSCLYSPESRSSASVCRSSSRTVPYISDLRPIDDYLALDGITSRTGQGNYAGVEILATLIDAPPSGSYLVASQSTAEHAPRTMSAGVS